MDETKTKLVEIFFPGAEEFRFQNGEIDLEQKSISFSGTCKIVKEGDKKILICEAENKIEN